MKTILAMIVALQKQARAVVCLKYLWPDIYLWADASQSTRLRYVISDLKFEYTYPKYRTYTYLLHATECRIP